MSTYSDKQKKTPDIENISFVKPPTIINLPNIYNRSPTTIKRTLSLIVNYKVIKILSYQYLQVLFLSKRIIRKR